MFNRRKVVFKKSVNEEEEYDGYVGKPCFQIGPNVKERDVPSNGEEYLLKVMKEREKCAKVTRCDLDISKLKKKGSGVSAEPENVDKPEIFKPTKEWQDIQTDEFSELHKYVIRMAAERKNSLPSMFQEKYKDFMKGGEILWKELFESTEPTLSHIVVLKQSYVESGLEAILSALKKVKPGESFEERTGLWFHSLLTKARHPPQSDDSYILRSLCRRCIEIRAALNRDDENVKQLVIPLNLFICLIAKYFGQHDLGDYELHDSKVGQIYYETTVAQITYE